MVGFFFASKLDGGLWNIFFAKPSKERELSSSSILLSFNLKKMG